MPTKKDSPKAAVTVSPKGTEHVLLKHRKKPDWKRQQELDEQREAEEIEKLATGEMRTQQQVLSSSTGRVIQVPQSREAPKADDNAGAEGQHFQGEWKWDMGAVSKQQATQERHAALLQDVDELGSQLDDLEGKIQSVPAIPNLNADDFLDIITGDASEAQLEFNQKSVLIIKKCREIRAGRAKVEKELAKKRLLVQKVADAHTRLLEAESREKLADCGSDDIAKMRDLVKDARRRVDEVKFAVGQQEKQLEIMEQAVKVELFGHNPKNRQKAEAFNIYSLVNEADGSLKRPGKPERIQLLHEEKDNLQNELQGLTNKLETRRQENGDEGSDEGARADENGDEAQDDQLSEEVLTEQVQHKTKKLQKLKTVLAATKARISALNAERAKNVAKIVGFLEDSDARDAQVQALQVRLMHGKMLVVIVFR